MKYNRMFVVVILVVSSRVVICSKLMGVYLSYFAFPACENLLQPRAPKISHGGRWCQLGRCTDTYHAGPCTLPRSFSPLSLMALHEVELNWTHRSTSGPKGSQPLSVMKCPPRTPTGPATLKTYREVFDRIVGSPQLGAKVL